MGRHGQGDPPWSPALRRGLISALGTRTFWLYAEVWRDDIIEYGASRGGEHTCMLPVSFEAVVFSVFLCSAWFGAVYAPSRSSVSPRVSSAL
jgi:hypothetical protein